MERKELLILVLIGVLVVTVAVQPVPLVTLSNSPVVATSKAGSTAMNMPVAAGGGGSSLENLPSMVGGC